MHTNLKIYDTDTFSSWRDKYNNLMYQLIPNELPISTNSPVDFIEIEIKSDNLKIQIPSTLHSLKYDVYWTYKAILNETTNIKLEYGNDFYETNDGQLTFNTVLIPNDKIVIKSYGIKDGKKWNDYFSKQYEYKLDNLIFDNSTTQNKTIIKLPYIIDFEDYTDVFVNGVKLATSDYNINNGIITINDTLSSDDNISFDIKYPLKDYEKYKILSSDFLNDEYLELKNNIDNYSLIVKQWEKDNQTELANDPDNVPTLVDSEIIARSIIVSQNNLNNLP